MLNEKKIKNIIRETINKLISKKDYINEITIGQKYDIESKSNKTKLPFELFSKLCQLDPTTKTDKVGKYANWILAKYQPNVDLQALKIALEWYADGIKRNILQREGVSTDINTYKSYEEFISVINSKMHSDSAQLSNTEVNHREKLKGQFDIIGSTSKFEIIKPLTFNAERYFGSGTEWCTVANESYFSSYMSKSPLYIVYPKDGNNDYKMQFHEQSHSFADKYDDVYETISECIFSLFEEDNIQANELRNLCKKIFNPNSIGLTTKEKLEALKGMTEIPDDYFYNSKISELTIPDSVTEIGKYAFYNCTSLTSITISDSVTSIGKGAFYNCTSLTSITIPNSVTSIERGVFDSCTSLTSITIPNSVTTIGYGVFAYCGSLTSITIPNSVTEIGEYAFSNCTSLTSVTIPDSVTTIGTSTFAVCSSLTSVTIPVSVTEIGSAAFARCSSLTSVAIPDSVTKIGNTAFGGCTSLTSITIPKSITEIEYCTFYGCESLTSITIPDSVRTIRDRAFDGCNSLTDTYINIKDLAAYITTSNPEIPGNKHLLVNGKEITELVIPNGVTSIKWGAFFNCESLTSITIPNSVTEIGDGAFRGCTSLTSITIPNSVTEIGDDAFLYCSSLKEIILPNRFKEDIDFIIGKTNANIRFYGQQNESLNKNKTGRIKYRLTENGLRKIIGESIKKILQDG